MRKTPHTRIFDELIPEFGLVGAAVYGVVWRYCQMRDGSCHATHETLANELGIGQSTVRQYIDELREAQYIAVIFDKANSPNWMILGEKQLSGDSTSTKEGASRKHLGASRKHLPKGGKVPADSTEETKELNKPVKKPTKATPSRQKKGRAPPSVRRFRKSSNRYPPKPLWPVIERAVGQDKTALQFWEEVVLAYIGCGWNPMNVKNMLAFFERREVPGEKRNGKPSKGMIALKEVHDG